LRPAIRSAAEIDVTGDIDGVVRQAIVRHRPANDEPFATLRPLRDLGIDVLALVRIVAEVESHFDIELPPHEVLSWSTPADMAASIESALGARSAPRIAR
jgi:acyl carrier protein